MSVGNDQDIHTMESVGQYKEWTVEHYGWTSETWARYKRLIIFIWISSMDNTPWIEIIIVVVFGWEVVRTVLKGTWKNFLSDENVLYLDWCVDYMGVYICQNLSNCTLSICVFHCNFYFNNTAFWEHSGKHKSREWVYLCLKRLPAWICHTKF